MNESKMEQLLRSWTPRRPSAGLEQRIFGGQDQPVTGLPSDGVLSWAASLNRYRMIMPAALSLCLALAVTLSGLGIVGHSGANQGGRTSMVAESNQSMTAYLAASLENGRNSWWFSRSSPIFGMDNGTRSHSSNASFVTAWTNLYRQ